MLPEGAPALIALVGTGTVGIALGGALSHCVPRSAPELRALCTAFVATGLVAAVFWAWALWHCLAGGFDAGVVSFLLFLAGVAHAAVFSLEVRSVVRRQAVLSGVAGALVVFNYAGGVAIALGGSKPLTLTVYFAVGAVAWAAATAWLLALCVKQLRALAEQGAAQPLT